MTTQNGRAFNDWLRTQLKAKKMSQRQLAQQSGVDHSTISRLIRGDRMPSLGHGHQACPRSPGAPRGRRHDAVPGPGRDRQHQPHGASRVRPPCRRAAERGAGAPDHGVLPRRADAPLRSILPANREPSRSTPNARRRRSLAWPARCPKPQRRPAASATAPRRCTRSGRSLVRPTGNRGATRASTSRPRVRPPGPSLGNCERRRLGRRRSRFRGVPRLRRATRDPGAAGHTRPGPDGLGADTVRAQIVGLATCIVARVCAVIRGRLQRSPSLAPLACGTIRMCALKWRPQGSARRIVTGHRPPIRASCTAKPNRRPQGPTCRPVDRDHPARRRRSNRSISVSQICRHDRRLRRTAARSPDHDLEEQSQITTMLPASADAASLRTSVASLISSPARRSDRPRPADTRTPRPT